MVSHRDWIAGEINGEAYKEPLGCLNNGVAYAIKMDPTVFPERDGAEGFVPPPPSLGVK